MQPAFTDSKQATTSVDSTLEGNVSWKDKRYVVQYLVINKAQWLANLDWRDQTLPGLVKVWISQEKSKSS